MSRGISSGARRHWAQINEAGFVTGMRLLFRVYRCFGRWPFRVMLYPVLGWYVLTRTEARRASADYLARVRQAGGAAPAPGVGGVIVHFGAFAECMLDKMLAWAGTAAATAVTFFGEQPLEADLAAGRGGLIVCSHFGNLELCRVLARRRARLKLTVLVHTRNARKFNQMLTRLDPDSQLNLFQVTELTPATAMLLHERVANGEFVVIAGDRVPVGDGGRTCTVDFLGAPARFPVGPWILASLLQCPVYLLFTVQTRTAAEIHFERLRDVLRLPRKTREAACIPLVREYAARLEGHCLRAPCQWFNFYDFWRAADKEPHHGSR